MKKRNIKNCIAPLGVGLAISASLFAAPVFLAHADDNIVLSFSATGTHTMEVDSGHLKIDGEFVDFKKDNTAKGTAICSSPTTCTIVIENEDLPGVLNYNTADKFELKVGGSTWTPDTEISTSLSFSVEDPTSSGPEAFSGNVWFVWRDGTTFKKFKITGIPGATMSTTEPPYAIYDTHYVSTSDITGFNMASIDTNADGEDYQFVWDKEHFTGGNVQDQSTGDVLAGFETWAQYKAFTASLDEDEYHDFTVDPTGAKNGENSISTNGDRAFRLTIRNSDYFGIVNATSPADPNLTYYPDFWNADFHNPEIDISGTSSSNPAILDSYLLESVIKLSAKNGTPITIAIDDDTPAAAVTISGGNITFNSRYYDQVRFKITAGGHDYYLLITRITIKAEGDVYVPSANTKSYDVYAHFTMRDNKKYDIKLDRDTSRDRADGGKGLKVLGYKLPSAYSNTIKYGGNDVSKIPKEVVYTVVESGSTFENYKGSLAGNGKGTGYEWTERGIKIKIRSSN